MDFFQFLQNSQNDKHKNNRLSENNKVFENNKLSENTKLNKLSENNQQRNEEVELYKNIKRGDMVKIIYVKDSILNSYKGYIGEIKDYKRDQDTALIFLHAISAYSVIKFPLNHFVKIDPFNINNE